MFWHNKFADVAPQINRLALVIAVIAGGVGIFVAIALLRIVIQLPLPFMLLIFYTLLFVCASIVPVEFLGVAFDAGGATTGPMTVPL